MKYSIQFLGLYDHYGDAGSHSKYVKWITKNCKGSWRYDSPNTKLNEHYKKPDNWPIFYKMIFNFTHKRDYEKFKETFT